MMNAETEEGGAKAIEVATLLGESVVDVKHCMDPKSGKITSRTWTMLGAGIASLLTAAIAFSVSVSTAAYNKGALEYWTHVAHKPAHAYRPHVLSSGLDFLAFGGLALGIAFVALALVRMRDEKRSPYYRIGTAPDVEQPVQGAPSDSFPLVAPCGDDFVMNFGPGISGDMQQGGKTVPLPELVASGRARPSAVVPGAFELTIPLNARIRAKLGQTSFVVSGVAKPRRHTAPLFIGMERRTAAYFAGSLAAHLAIILLLRLIPVEEGTASIEFALNEELAIKTNGSQMQDPPEQVADRDGGSSQSEGKGASMKFEEGAAGDKNSPNVDGHLRIANRNVDPQLARVQAIEEARNAGILGSVSLASGSPFAALDSTSEFSSGFDSTDTWGPLYGAEGTGHGAFGYGRTGFGLGGGCGDVGCGIIGTEPGYGKIGTGRRGLNGWDGPGGGGIGTRRRTPGVPTVAIGLPIQTGDLDKAIIRRYIKMNLTKIGYCYEKELLARPTLAGDVMVSFFITPTGSVKTAVGSGVDPTVANCVASVVGAIQFPKPNGGGGVQVNYPFTFRAAK